MCIHFRPSPLLYAPLLARHESARPAVRVEARAHISSILRMDGSGRVQGLITRSRSRGIYSIVYACVSFFVHLQMRMCLYVYLIEFLILVLLRREGWQSLTGLQSQRVQCSNGAAVAAVDARCDTRPIARFRKSSRLYVRLHICFGDLVGPVEQHLPDNWRHGRVVHGCTSRNALVEQISLPAPYSCTKQSDCERMRGTTLRTLHWLVPDRATFLSCNAIPSRHLPVVVFCSATTEEAAVPVKPPARILFMDPALGFPATEKKRKKTRSNAHRHSSDAH